MRNKLIFPRALVVAARTFKDKPAVVGEILIQLVTGGVKGLSDVQKYVVAECVSELDELTELRASAAERKRRQRARKEVA